MFEFYYRLFVTDGGIICVQYIGQLNTLQILCVLYKLFVKYFADVKIESKTYQRSAFKLWLC
jgi:hypothetical protein